MKKKELLIFLLSASALIAIIGFLVFGKCIEVKILTPENRETSYLICKGELVGSAGSIDADANISREELLEKVNSMDEYGLSDIFNKGYSNNQVISIIKSNLESKGATVTTNDQGLTFVGFKWIIHKFSSK